MNNLALRTYNEYPESAKSNTDFYIMALNIALRDKGSFLPSHIAETIRECKPEAIMRARRAIVHSTSDQLAEAIRYRTEYKPDNPNPYVPL
jgi:hypothetical protein